MAIVAQREPIPRLVRLGNGDRLSLWECGDLSGRPLLYCHGWPSAGSQCLMLDAEAKKGGWHVYSPSRPGIGYSDFQPSRTLLDWPQTVDMLLDGLQIERCSVLAVSGGCPYALSVAAGLPGRVDQVVIVSGAAPARSLCQNRETLILYRWLLAWHAQYPFLCELILRVLGGWVDDRMLSSMTRLVTPLLAQPDRILFHSRDIQANVLRPVLEALSKGPRGCAVDGRIYGSDWNLPWENIGCPVTFWHGGLDRNIPLAALQDLRKNLPGSEIRILHDEGHYSLPILHTQEIIHSMTASR